MEYIFKNNIDDLKVFLTDKQIEEKKGVLKK